MPSGLRKENRAICDSIPYPYSCVHLSEYYGKEPFEALKSETGKRYPDSQWILCKYDKRLELDLDILALSKSDDRDNLAKINRIKASIVSRQKLRIEGRYYGDFKNPIECCQYLLEIGALKAMPKAVVEKQENQLNGNAAKQLVEKPSTVKPSHLTKLSSNPEYVMVLRTLEMLEFFGSEEACNKALQSTLEHLRESEAKWTKYVETVRNESESLGLDADEAEAYLQKKKRQRTEKLASTLTLDYPKEE